MDWDTSNMGTVIFLEGLSSQCLLMTLGLTQPGHPHSGRCTE